MLTGKLRIEHLSKTFPGQVALSDVGLEVESGEIHALVGQNGSGKSTLIKILAGYHQPDQGEGGAWIDETPLTLGDGPAATAAGIRFVHQDLGLVGSNNTIENIALAVGYRTGRGRRIKWRDEARRTRQALGGLGLSDIDIKAPINTLPPSQRTAVAIVRALVGLGEGGAQESVGPLLSEGAGLAEHDRHRREGDLRFGEGVSDDGRSDHFVLERTAVALFDDHGGAR